MTQDQRYRAYRQIMALLEHPNLENLEDAGQLLHDLIDDRRRTLAQTSHTGNWGETY